MIFICFSSSSKILTHQMSSGALTAALGRSNRDRDITDLVPSAPECSYAACFCEVIKLANTFHTISYNFHLTLNNKINIDETFEYSQLFRKMFGS